jgi:AcrR family transcriptional regulator
VQNLREPEAEAEEVDVALDGAPAWGLRERQRQESLQQIHTAASELVAERGLADTTIAAIAERSGVSRRTLFNYYPSKEDAVLGLTHVVMPDDALNEFLEHPGEGDRLGRMVVLLARSVANIRQTGTSREELHRLANLHPELKSRMQQRFQEMQEQLRELALHKIDERDDVGHEERAVAEATITLAGAILKYTFRMSPEILHNPTREAFTPAIAAFQAALKEVK